MIIGINTRLLLSHRMEGIARFSWETTKRMIFAHPEDEFVLFFDRKYDTQFIIADNVKAVVILPQARHPLLWKIWFDYALVWAMKKHRIDVFFSPDGFCSLRTNIPTLMVTHDLTYVHYPETMRKDQISYYQKNVPLFHKKVDHVIAVSLATKKDVITQFGLSPKKISVAYNALQNRRRIEEESEIKGDYFLYLGSIHPRKNIVTLVKAYEMFRKKWTGLSPKLVLAGRRAFENNELNDLVIRSEYKEDIVFLGMVDEARKWNLLQNAKLFVYISLFEGFGIPVLEAMQARTPVICSDSGALAEVSGDAAFWVNPKKEEEISDAIYKVYTNDDLQADLLEKGRKRVEEFSWDKSADTIYDKLKSLYS